MVKLAPLLLVFVATFAQAQQLGTGEFYILGGGNESCGVWLETRNHESARLQRAQWLLGFLTGYNSANSKGLSRSRQVQLQDGQSALAFVDRYCSNNPLHVVGAATLALVEALGGEKTEHSWKR